MYKAVNLWLFGVILAGLIITLPTVVLRIIGRRRRRSLQTDDWTMVLTEFFCIPCVILALVAISNGLGFQDDQLDPEHIITATKLETIFEFFYCITVGLLRISLSLSLLRFAIGRRMRQAIYALVILHTITTIAFFVGLLVLCRPFRANWRHFYDLPGYPKEGYCFGGPSLQAVLYAMTAYSSLTDLICVIIPAILFWNMQMSRRKKIMAWMLLSLGCLASIAALSRIPFAPYWEVNPNRVWGLGMGTLCCCIEVILGIIAGCAPAIKPFFVAMFSSVKSRIDSGNDITLPSTRPSKVRASNGLTNFSYNTTDLKMIHSPRGDVIEIPAISALNNRVVPAPTNTLELGERAV